jgi:hypothetical protein
VLYEGNQGLSLIVEPFLITKQRKDDHHGCAHEMVIDIVPENTEFHQGSVDEIHKSLCEGCVPPSISTKAARGKERFMMGLRSVSWAVF